MKGHEGEDEDPRAKVKGKGKEEAEEFPLGREAWRKSEGAGSAKTGLWLIGGRQGAMPAGGTVPPPSSVIQQFTTAQNSSFPSLHLPAYPRLMNPHPRHTRVDT